VFALKLLITGAKGQLGTELVRLGSDHELFAVDRDELDITDPAAVLKCLNGFHPDAVINAAAYTAVDRAESDVDAAFAVNRDGPANLARACEQDDIPLIHVSTDYVFDGAKQGAYVESDPVAPLGVYGASKLAGELTPDRRCSNIAHALLFYVPAGCFQRMVIILSKRCCAWEQKGMRWPSCQISMAAPLRLPNWRGQYIWVETHPDGGSVQVGKHDCGWVVRNDGITSAKLISDD